MQCLWTLFALFSAALLELVLGHHGLSLPLFCMVSFHFFVFRHWLLELFSALVLGVFLDAAFVRPLPEHLVLVLAMFALARFWRECQLTYMMLLQAIPGVAVGGICAFVQQCVAMVFYESLTGADVLVLVLQTLKGIGMGAVALPVVLWMLDRLSGRLGLQRYSRIGGEGLSSAQLLELEEWGDDIS